MAKLVYSLTVQSEVYQGTIAELDEVRNEKVAQGFDIVKTATGKQYHKVDNESDLYELELKKYSYNKR